MTHMDMMQTIVFFVKLLKFVQNHYAEQIRNNIACSSFDFQGNSVSITASLGVAGTEQVGNIDLEELIKLADRTLYIAKKAAETHMSL